MEPIFTRDAIVVGWLKNEIVYDEHGYAQAYIRNTVVFSFDGEFLGRLERGYFVDEQGDAVAFTRGAQGGPTPPSPRVVPEPPSLAVLPNWPTPHVIPKRHEPTMFWSQMDWPTYLHPPVTAE